MFNLSITPYKNFLELRKYDFVFCHDSTPPVPMDEVPFNDSKGNPLKGRNIGADTFEHRAAESSRCSMSRTRSKLRNICFSFEPEWFVTFTFNKDAVNRYDYDDCLKNMRSFIRHLQYLDSGLQYCIVPEKHKDGAFHFHGLFAGNIPLEYAGKFGKTHTKTDVYHCPDYQKYGFDNWSKVLDPAAIGFYITKYMTKDLTACTKNRQRYLYSTKTIEVKKKMNFLITDKSWEALKVLLLDWIYSKKKGRGFYEVKGDFLKFEQALIIPSVFQDIVDFCYSYDDGSSSVSLC